ncbi:MAG: hypothetical protein J0L88_10850, partial [Xanthomonadales bacterium]|nr:hypothetical protein [Xanthomonadales bacterium]
MAARLRYVFLTLVMALAALALALHFAARGEARRMAAALAPFASLQYDGSGFTWNGGLRLDAPRLEIREGPWRGTLQARVATLRSGGGWWLLARSIGDATDLPSDARIDIRGLTLATAAGIPGLEQWLRVPGTALFEMQGCPGPALGVPERAGAGVHGGERVDRVDYRRDDATATLDVDFTLEQPGIASVQGSFELASFDRRAAGFPAGARLSRGEVDYVDLGYLAARNRLCARRLDIDIAHFIERHMTAVDALLATHRIGLGDGVRTVYRRLVTDGGMLRFTVLPDAGWRPAQWAETTRGELLRELNVTARHDDAPPVMLQLVFDEPGEPLLAAPQESAIPATTAAVEAGTDAARPETSPAASDTPLVDIAPPLVSAAQAAPPPSPVPAAPAPVIDTPVAAAPMAVAVEPATATAGPDGTEPAGIARADQPMADAVIAVNVAAPSSRIIPSTSAVVKWLRSSDR